MAINEPEDRPTRVLLIEDDEDDFYLTRDLLRQLPGDRYVLCSDGLSGMITDPGILEIVNAAGDDVELAVRNLVGKANENGGEDNVTVVVLLVTA